jgi:hypothetical protein
MSGTTIRPRPLPRRCQGPRLLPAASTHRHPMRFSLALRPLPLAGLTALGLAALLAFDAARHGGRPAFAGAWLALVVWPLLAASLAWGLATARRSPQRLVLLGVSLVFALGALELLLPRLFPERNLPRLRGVRSHLLHHALPADSTLFAGRYDRSGAPVLVRTNQDGLRTDYARERYRASPQRIAVLGDSFVFGWAVAAEAAWPARLEASLQSELGPGVAVLNAGVFSYSPLLSRRQWRTAVAAYEPQLVLLMLDATDIGDDWKYRHELAADGNFPWPDQRKLPWRGAVVELLRPLLDQLRPALLYPARVLRHASSAGGDYYDFRLELAGQVETNRFFIYRHPLEVTRPFFAAAWSEVEALAAEVEATGARFAVVVMPRFHHWNPREAPRNWEADQYRTDEPWADEMFRFYAERAAEAPFPVIDLLPAFRATDRFPLVFEHDPHLDEAGNQFVAEVLTEPVSRLLADATGATRPPA